MKKKIWFHYYLLFIGSAILTLGVILLFRTYFLHRTVPGFILGATLVIYGLLRLRQRKVFPLER